MPSIFDQPDPSPSTSPAGRPFSFDEEVKRQQERDAAAQRFRLEADRVAQGEALTINESFREMARYLSKHAAPRYRYQPVSARSFFSIKSRPVKSIFDSAPEGYLLQTKFNGETSLFLEGITILTQDGQVWVAFHGSHPGSRAWDGFVDYGKQWLTQRFAAPHLKQDFCGYEFVKGRQSGDFVLSRHRGYGEYDTIEFNQFLLMLAQTILKNEVRVPANFVRV
jgi:hypothetical protein